MTKFIDLAAQQDAIRINLDITIAKILKHGQYVMGPEVFELEKELAKFSGAKHAISCGNGTDALMLVLMSQQVNANSAIFLPSFTYAATAEVVKHLGAQPIFIDSLPHTYNMDPESLKAGIKKAKDLGLKATAIITVDLFGQPVDYDSTEAIAKENNLWILCDSAQSFGATYKDRNIGTIGLATATSFFPSKPLGCYGDGGCIFTDSDELAATVRSLKVNGRSSHNRYEHTLVGVNSRLDTLQAGILLEKLKIFPEEIQKRRRIAATYNNALNNLVDTPKVIDGANPIWALYTITLKNSEIRQKIQEDLAAHDIPSVIYYPKPLHKQIAFVNCITASDHLTITEQLSETVLSLPMHPYLDISDEYLDALKNTLEKHSVALTV